MNRLCSCIHHERLRNFTSFLPTANILQLVSIFVKKGILFLVKLNLLIGASIKKNVSINITGEDVEFAWNHRNREETVSGGKIFLHGLGPTLYFFENEWLYALFAGANGVISASTDR